MEFGSENVSEEAEALEIIWDVLHGEHNLP